MHITIYIYVHICNLLPYGTLQTSVFPSEAVVTDVAEVKHLEAAALGHQHPATRELASFLRKIKEIQDPEFIVYITAVGGVPFANYIQGPITNPMIFHGKRCHGVRNWCRIHSTSLESWAPGTGYGLYGHYCPGKMFAGCDLGGVEPQTAKQTYVLF